MNKIIILIVAVIFFTLGYWSHFESGQTESVSPIVVDKTNFKNNNALSSEIFNSDLILKSEKTTVQEKQMQVINKLKQQLKVASRNLQEKEVELSNVTDELFAFRSEFSKQNREQKPETLLITKEVAESALPKPFSNFFIDATGKQAEGFNNFQDEEQNYDWAYLMEIQIKDFMTIHPEAGNITVQAVTCKTSMCEIMAFESIEQATQKVLRDMRHQSWWQFRNTRSSSSSSEEFGLYYYIMVSK